MDRSTIESLMREAEAKYNKLNQLSEEVRSRLKELGLIDYHEIHEEMNRLQGEFRALDGLRVRVPDNTPVSQADPATTIDVEQTLKNQETQHATPKTKRTNRKQ